MYLEVSGRHAGVQEIARYFDFAHLGGDLRDTSATIAAFAQDMINRLPDSPELTAGLRKLLEAKDCFVRAALPR